MFTYECVAFSLCFTQEEYGHLVMLSLFDVIDDTVLVKKVIFPVSNCFTCIL